MRDTARPLATVDASPVDPDARLGRDSGLWELVGVLEERVAWLVEQRRDSLKVIEELQTRLAERDAELRRAMTELSERELVREDLLGRVTKLIELVAELEDAQDSTA